MRKFVKSQYEIYTTNYTNVLSNIKCNVVGDMPRGWAELKGHIIAQT